jgi:uncharacterized membrane protein YcaP (DUF421 family)
VEIVIRATVLFLFLWGVTRAVGRPILGELSTFELLLYVTIGDLVQQAVTQQDYSITGGVLAVSVFALLTVILHWTQWRFPRTRDVINGVPLVIVRDGEILSDVTRAQRLSTTDVLATARQQGIRSITDVELAVLEADGRVSFFTRSDSEAGAPETGISS